MIVERLRGTSVIRASLMGALVSVVTAPSLVALKPFFSVPRKGIGLVTLLKYPKGWDYAVVAILFASTAVVSLAVGFVIGWWRERRPQGQNFEAPQTTAGRPPDVVVGVRRPRLVFALMIVTALVTLPARDDPYEFIDPYHHGDHLSPASEMLRGARPYRDIFFTHGIATDGGLDLLVMGSPPIPLRAFRFRAFLSCLTLAVLVPIAAELTFTVMGLIGGVAASLAALAAGEVTTFPFFRLLPLLLMVWLVLRYVRLQKDRELILATCLAGAGMFWSVDIGMFAIGGLWGWMFLTRRLPWRRVIALAGMTVGTPLLLLLMVRADLGIFLRDTFLRLPECFDAILSLPAPSFPSSAEEWISGPAARYYVPIIAYGVMFAAAFLVRELQRAEALLLFSITELLHFRVAAGRTGWSHDRFAVPLLGIAFVAFVAEPLLRRRRLAPAICGLSAVIVAAFHFEVADNVHYLRGYYASYPARMVPPPDRVPYRVPRLRSLYTYQQDADDTRALYLYSQSMPAGPIFDYSGEKLVYYMLNRPAAARCEDVPYLSDPKLAWEAIRQLETNTPVFIVLQGLDGVNQIDKIGYATRTPLISEWIDKHYRRRTTVGRYTIALPDY